MFIDKKFFGTLMFLALFLFVLARGAYAQCDTFDFPRAQGGSLFFFNCDSGELQQFDASNMLNSVPGKLRLGGFIHNFIWSPDGNSAFVLAENVSAAVQELEFFSQERDPDSLNWWLYNLNTGKAEILDKSIISIGWASNDEAVYNWNNENLSMAKVDNLKLGSHVKLADITNDSNDLEGVVSPILSEKVLIFPMKKGFYSIDSTKKEARYNLLEGGIQKIAANPFKSNEFVIMSGKGLFGFSASGESLTEIDSDFSAADFAFLDSFSLVIVANDGKVYSYGVDTKKKNPIALDISGSISKVFSTGNKGEFIFTTGRDVYRKNVLNNSLLQYGKGGSNIEQPEQEDTSDEAKTKLQAPTQRTTASSMKYIYALFAVLIIGIFGFFIYKKLIKRR